MKNKVLAMIAGISVTASCLTPGVVLAEETYYEDGSYEEYYDDGSYDDGSYEEYYDDGSYDDSYYDDGSYEEEYYDDGSYEEEYYDDSSYEEAAAETSSDTSEEASWHQNFRTEITRGNGEREEADADGKIHSYLTGKLTDQNLVLRRPVAVMINNIINALPQAGISKAAVIYEAPVEGDITRMMALFEDMEGLEKIGPVRSCRDYFVDFALEFDAIYTHFGQAVYAYDLLNSDMVDNISGLEYQDGVGKINGYAGEDIFYRTSDREAPHNCYTSAEGIEKAIERKDYDMELDDEYEGHFKFAADGEIVTYTDGTATHIEPHKYANTPYFDYDEETHKYLRSEYPDRSAGPAQIDELTGEQLAVDNVIIQYCKIKPYDDNGYLNVNTNYGGEAILFTQGTYQKATWEKATDWGPARYYDADGNEIAINQGQTWVCIVEDTRSGDTSFE
ncbi:MAG: DUF3048 domain-containing protein [Muricoprocola sp.]